MKDFLFVDGEFSHEIVISRSRFIASAKGVNDIGEAEAFVAAISKKYGDATHNCYAYVLNADSTEQKFCDDGEPQGTAGMPILEIIKKKNLFCTVVVVTRYFGGVKLGAGGLVGAYGRVTAECLDTADIKLNRFSDVFEVVCGYTEYSLLEKRFKNNDSFANLGVEYGDNVVLTVAVPETNSDELVAKINDLTLGTAKITKKEKRYYSYQI